MLIKLCSAVTENSSSAEQTAPSVTSHKRFRKKIFANAAVVLVVIIIGALLIFQEGADMTLNQDINS